MTTPQIRNLPRDTAGRDERCGCCGDPFKDFQRVIVDPSSRRALCSISCARTCLEKQERRTRHRRIDIRPIQKGTG